MKSNTYRHASNLLKPLYNVKRQFVLKLFNASDRTIILQQSVKRKKRKSLNNFVLIMQQIFSRRISKCRYL